MDGIEMTLEEKRSQCGMWISTGHCPGGKVMGKEEMDWS